MHRLAIVATVAVVMLTSAAPARAFCLGFCTDNVTVGFSHGAGRGSYGGGYNTGSYNGGGYGRGGGRRTVMHTDAPLAGRYGCNADGSRNDGPEPPYSCVDRVAPGGARDVRYVDD